MKKITTLLTLLCVAAAIAQGGKQNVAVYMAGKEPVGAKGAHKILGSELAKAITNSDTYSAVDRTDAVLKQIEKEHQYQRSGAVSDEQIKALGRQLGIQYLCIAEISEVKGGTYFLEARLVDVEKATVLKIASVNSTLKDNKEIVSAGQRVAWGLILKKNEIINYVPEEILADPNKAIVDYTDAIKAKPNEAEYFNNRGLAYLEKKDYDIAIADFTDAIRLKPNEAKYFGNRGKCYQHTEKDYSKAIADYTEAIRLEPNNAFYRSSRARVWDMWWWEKNYDKAIADYTESIRLEPNNAFYRSSRAGVWCNSWWNEKDYDKAIADYTEAIRLEPKNAEYRSYRAYVYSQKEDYDKAVADYTEAIRLEPKNAKYYRWRSIAYRDKGDYNKALVDATNAIRLKPNEASNYVGRGIVYLNKGDYGKAITDFEAALRIEPYDIDAEAGLERAKKERGY